MPEEETRFKGTHLRTNAPDLKFKHRLLLWSNKLSLISCQLRTNQMNQFTLDELISALSLLYLERKELRAEGWYLQNCWLVQVKPAGTARTNRYYWQVRSRQAMFNGRKLKHLKDSEVEKYKAAIARGQKLSQIDHEIERLQCQFDELLLNLEEFRPSPQSNQNGRSSKTSAGVTATSQPKLNLEQAKDTKARTRPVDQELSIDELILENQRLQDALRKTIARSKELEAVNLECIKRCVRNIDKANAARSLYRFPG